MLVGITVFVFFGQSLFSLFKWGWHLVIQMAIGAFLLFSFNLFGQLIHIYLPLNLITSLFVGILGLPGLVTLVIIKAFIIPL